jgi:hypothetical protein
VTERNDFWLILAFKEEGMRSSSCIVASCPLPIYSVR